MAESSDGKDSIHPLCRVDSASRDRIDAAEAFYVDDDQDYALDRFIATVFNIGWEQGYADTKRMLDSARKALRSESSDQKD